MTGAKDGGGGPGRTGSAPMRFVLENRTDVRRGKDMTVKRKIQAALLCGMLGCVCFGAGDWLMIYGDTAHSGALAWLTEGAAAIAPWRNAVAMALAFPGIILYGIALFAIAAFLREEKQRRIYHYLTAFGLTPWIGLHLFYIMILYGFAWMSADGYQEGALAASEAMFAHLSWVVILSEALMLPPYLYWFWVLARGNSAFPKRMTLINPLILYALLKLITLLMPESAFRLAFTNGLMSESMIIWFAAMLAWNARQRPRGMRQAPSLPR